MGFEQRGRPSIASKMQVNERTLVKKRRAILEMVSITARAVPTMAVEVDKTTTPKDFRKIDWSEASKSL